MSRTLKFYEAILEATDQAMESDSSVFTIGLGVPDPKGIFGTTTGLQKKYGEKRVLDMPVSENAMTGILIGSAIAGMRPIMTHQRVDFFLLALDQLINNAAKWHYMFDKQMTVPLVIRLIIGRGWGQGPQHSQTLHSLFAHIPGLKVVMPATPYDAKGLLAAAIKDNNPVVYLEHRWLHSTFGEVPQENYDVEIGKARVLKEGSDLTIVTCSYMTIESLKAAKALEEMGISVEIVDLRTIKPLDIPCILQSLKKTQRLMVVDPDWKFAGLSAEIVAVVAEELHGKLKAAPVRVTHPEGFCPTSWTLSNHYYPGVKEIVVTAMKMMGKDSRNIADYQHQEDLKMHKPLDVPDLAFTGPF